MYRQIAFIRSELCVGMCRALCHHHQQQRFHFAAHTKQSVNEKNTKENKERKERGVLCNHSFAFLSAEGPTFMFRQNDDGALSNYRCTFRVFFLYYVNEHVD